MCPYEKTVNTNIGIVVNAGAEAILNNLMTFMLRDLVQRSGLSQSLRLNLAGILIQPQLLQGSTFILHYTDSINI